MNDEEYHNLVLRRIETGEPILNVKDLPACLVKQIASIALSARFLGSRGDLEFDMEVDADGKLSRVSWQRQDDTKTINLIADGTWYTVYKSPTTTYVSEVDDDGHGWVDTTTMEAVMLMAGVHPTQL